MHRIAMNELTTYRWSFEDDVRHYAEMGFQAIGVWRAKLSDFGEEKGCELLREYGMRVSSLLWAGGFTGSDGRTHRDSIRDAMEAITLAAQMSAGCLIVYTGARGGHTQRHARRLFRTAVDRVLPVAEEHGVVLAIEPVSKGCGGDFTFLHGIDDALTYVEEYNSPHLKLALDTYCLADDTLDMMRLRELTSEIAIVQLGDAKAPPRGEPNRCQLGQGVLPLGDVVGALTEGGYEGCWEIELLGEDVEAEDYREIVVNSRAAVRDLLLAQR